MNGRCALKGRFKNNLIEILTYITRTLSDIIVIETKEKNYCFTTTFVRLRGRPLVKKLLRKLRRSKELFVFIPFYAFLMLFVFLVLRDYCSLMTSIRWKLIVLECFKVNDDEIQNIESNRIVITQKFVSLKTTRYCGPTLILYLAESRCNKKLKHNPGTYSRWLSSTLALEKILKILNELSINTFNTKNVSVMAVSIAFDEN